MPQMTGWTQRGVNDWVEITVPEGFALPADFQLVKPTAMTSSGGIGLSQQMGISNEELAQMGLIDYGGVGQELQAGGFLIPALAGLAPSVIKFLLPYLAKYFPAIAAAGGAIAAGVGIQQITTLEGIGKQPVIPGTTVPLVGPGALEPPAWMTVKHWKINCNGKMVNFYKLINGQIAVRRPDGSYKVYRPQKHIVVSRNPRTGTLIRADKRLSKLVMGLVHIKTKRSKRGFTLRSGRKGK